MEKDSFSNTTVKRVNLGVLAVIILIILADLTPIWFQFGVADKPAYPSNYLDAFNFISKKPGYYRVEVDINPRGYLCAYTGKPVACSTYASMYGNRYTGMFANREWKIISGNPINLYTLDYLLNFPAVIICNEDTKITGLLQSYENLGGKVFNFNNDNEMDTFWHMVDETRPGEVMVELKSRGNDYITLSVKNPKREATVFISEAYFPGWKAYDNGKLTPIYPVEPGLMAVIVNNGEHYIELKYMPTQIHTLGLIITLLAVVFSTIVLRYPNRRSGFFDSITDLQKSLQGINPVILF